MGKINYDEFRNFYTDPFKRGKYADFLEDTLYILDEQEIITEYDIFYPKGMFIDENLTAYFFAKNIFHAVKIETNKMTIKSWNNTEISSVALIVPDRFNLGLVISLKDGKEIELNSNLDTNSAWSKSFRDRIQDIHKYLLNKR